MAEFKTGDLVQLKSGGPTMTVKSAPDDSTYSDEYHCVWFAGSKLSDGHFLADSLLSVDENKSSGG